jgi:hypothetical protein
VPHTQTPLEDALGREILAEVSAQGRTHKEIQTVTGIKSRTWGEYFVQKRSAIPFPAIERVCDALGVEVEVMLRRARARVDQMESHAARADAALSRVSPEGQRRARKIAREIRPQSEEEDLAADRTASGPITRTASTGR